MTTGKEIYQRPTRESDRLEVRLSKAQKSALERLSVQLQRSMTDLVLEGIAIVIGAYGGRK